MLKDIFKSKKTENTSSKGNNAKKYDARTASLKSNQKAILNKSTSFIIQEAYKTARTNIIFSVSASTKSGCKIIAYTSASPGEGKTTTCINLAIAFAQTGAKVLVVDGDMRNPRIHQYLGVEKTNGLSTVLSHQKTANEVIYKDLRPNMDLIASGSIPPNPAELLSSGIMKDLLDELSPVYDYIFFDTPPATVVTDAIALSSYLDGMVVVVREGFTTHESLEHAINLMKLAKAKILGFFVNDIDPNNANYGVYQHRYGRGYKKYGKYGYGNKYGYSYNYKYNYNYRYGDNPETHSIHDSSTAPSAVDTPSDDNAIKEKDQNM